MHTMRAVTLKAFGAADVLQLSHVPHVSLSRVNEVIIQVRAAGVNRVDLSQRRGHYAPPKGCSEILGLEVAGVVVQTGAAVTRFREGDHVMALLSGGGYAEMVSAHKDCVMPIPKGYSFDEAAAIPETFLTAWQVLKLHGNVQKGQNVLIHAGASGLGTALAQLTEKYFGATAIGTCSPEKLEFCKQYASIAIDRTPSESGKLFAPKVCNALGADEAVHLVVDPVVGGEYLNENCDVLAQNGKIVIIAFMGGSKVNINLLPLFRKNASLLFSRLRFQADEYKAALVSSFEKEVIPMLEERKVTPVLQKVFPIDDVVAAHTMVEDNKTHGKVVLSFKREENGVCV